jgi:hypothetical protein
MPSDERTARALAALAATRDQYRSALAATLEEVRVYLDTHRSAAADRLAQLGAELGPVGVQHIDVRRFASVIGSEPAVEPASQAVMTRALDVLNELSARPDEAFMLVLARGDNLYQTVSALLADFGRAMGAARVVDLARSGRYRPSEHDGFLHAYPFGMWSQSERQLAPPVVIELDGADLRPGGLAEFLDGAQKIVLVVRGESSPAPLVRLVTPRTFVAQTTDAALLPRLVSWEGPGLVGLMPAASAHFVHDPAAGNGLASRLTVTEIPTNGKRRAGPFTSAQQQEELAQLKALQATAQVAAAPVGAPETAAPADPVDKLAAWLLQQADLSGA